jgi:hypothetical protein
MVLPSISQVYVKWVSEQPSSSGSVTRWGAWLVRDIVDDLGTRTEFLAYLGTRPRVTEDLKWEMSELYANLNVDWDAIAQALSSGTPRTDARGLSDDEIALHFRELARERGLSLQDLASRLHIQPRNILQETETLVRTEGNRERFEERAGSIFAYLAQSHPEYAYALLKVRLFLEGEEAELERLLREEPLGFSSQAVRQRKAHWAAALVCHLAAHDHNA